MSEEDILRHKMSKAIAIIKNNPLFSDVFSSYTFIGSIIRNNYAEVTFCDLKVLNSSTKTKSKGIRRDHMPHHRQVGKILPQHMVGSWVVLMKELANPMISLPFS